MIDGGILLRIDRWFGWLYHWAGRLDADGVVRPDNPKRILIIKFMGMGSLVQLANQCDRLGIDKSNLILLTRSSHRSICKLLGFTQAWYVSSLPPLTILHLINIFYRTRRWRPDLIIDLERCSNAVGLLRTLLARAGHSYSVSFEERRSVQLPHQEIHAANQLTLLDLFSIGLAFIPRSAQQQNRQRWSARSNRILINLNASPYLLERRLPTQHLDTLLRELKKIIPQAEFLLTGSDQEKAFVQHVIDMTPGFRLQNVAGAWTLETLQQELATCLLFITGDSGPLHLAVRMGTPAVVVWGPTQPAHFGYDQNPRVFSVSQNRPCAPCLTHPHSKPMAVCGGKADCMQHISIKAMMSACLAALQVTSNVSWSPAQPDPAGHQ
jgi:ADP-heptose:LPS heptosyltransferase